MVLKPKPVLRLGSFHNWGPVFRPYLGVSVTSLGGGKLKLKPTLLDLEPPGTGNSALIERLEGEYLNLQYHPNSIYEVY